MFLPYLALLGLLTAGASDGPFLTPPAAMVQLTPAARIKPGMTEEQVEWLLHQRASGRCYFGCGTCAMAAGGGNHTMHICFYWKSKVIVTYENDKVWKVSSWE